ncbi:hypothetical protein OOU_Y34scaffold00165g4 [Pyricularia oryzae Y34]|uniref:Uncharacterized protein n=2 Tax=Pyricularia oryzae TaxID=318829 RepID=A0AA97P7P3_PYRO3|nr:hypothetical protein OOU_Y34scaffold00165g4 [Pyricularia oryzae Y34]
MLTNRGYRFLVLGFERVLRAPCHQQAHQTPHCRTLGVEPWGSGSVFGMPPVPSTPSRAGRHVGDEHDFSPPSAAVAAASKELLDLEFEGLENFFGLNGESNYLPGFQGRPKSPSRNITSTPTIHEEDEGANDDDDGLASDIAAAREASVSFSTKLQKKRIRRRRKPSTREDDDTETETQRRHRRHQHERSKHRDAVDGDSSSDHPRRRQRSRSRSPLAGKRHHRKLRREEHQRPPQTPPPPRPAAHDDDAGSGAGRGRRGRVPQEPAVAALVAGPVPAAQQPEHLGPDAIAGAAAVDAAAQADGLRPSPLGVVVVAAGGGGQHVPADAEQQKQKHARKGRRASGAGGLL